MTTTIRTDDPERPLEATTRADVRPLLDGYEGWAWGGTASFDGWCAWVWRTEDASTLSLAAYLTSCGEHPRDYISDPLGRAILDAYDRAQAEAAAALGRRGGQVGGRARTDAKAAAARANGRKGGRPRKQPPAE